MQMHYHLVASVGNLTREVFNCFNVRELARPHAMDRNDRLGSSSECRQKCRQSLIELVDAVFVLNMDYVEFPLLAVFMFPRDEEDHIGFTAEIGPCFGYNTRAEAQLTGTAEVTLADNSTRVQNYDERVPIQGDINKWAVSGVVGAALEFYLAKQTIILEGRYQFDVTSISSDQDSYNHVFSLMIGFMAPITN